MRRRAHLARIIVMACHDLECLHAAIRRIIELSQQTWAPEWMDVNATFTLDRARKLHAKNVDVGAVLESLKLGVSPSTMGGGDVDDGQDEQAVPTIAATRRQSVVKKPAAKIQKPKAKTVQNRGPWRQFIAERSRGSNDLADTRSLSGQYHDVSEDKMNQLKTDARITSDAKRNGEKDLATGTTRELMRYAKRQKMEQLVNDIGDEVRTDRSCVSLVAAGSAGPKGREQFHRRIALQAATSRIGQGTPFEEAVATVRLVERASAIVAANVRQERHDLLVEWHKTSGRAMVNSFLETIPLFHSHRDQLVPIPDRNVNCFLIRQDVEAVAMASSNIQAAARQLSLHTCLGEAFAGRCQPILDKDLKRLHTARIGGPPRPCLKKLVCLCTGDGNDLWEFNNRLKRAMKMQYDRKRPNLLRPLLEKMVVMELVGHRPASTSPVAIVRARREQNLDITVPYETHEFFHVAHMRLSPYEPWLRKMIPMYDDPDNNEKHVKAVTWRRGGVRK